jgi:hypothetical protein
MEISDRIEAINSCHAKDGVEGTRAQRKRVGRPTVAEVRGDPDIASKALEMRDLGLSWSQIASRLGIGRTTARRLSKACQKDEKNWLEKGSNRFVPKGFDDNKVNKRGQCIAPSHDDDILGKMPKTFRIFSNLLEKARKIQEKGRRDLNL